MRTMIPGYSGSLLQIQALRIMAVITWVELVGLSGIMRNYWAWWDSWLELFCQDSTSSSALCSSPMEWLPQMHKYHHWLSCSWLAVQITFTYYCMNRGFLFIKLVVASHSTVPFNRNKITWSRLYVVYFVSDVFYFALESQYYWSDLAILTFSCHLRCRLR